MSWGRIDDCEELMHEAMSAIAGALRDGDKKHEPGSWMNETPEDLIQRALMHLGNVLAGIEKTKSGGSQMSHAICDLAMARALRKRMTMRTLPTRDTGV